MVSSLFQLEHVSSNSKGLTNFVINHWFSEIQSLSATYWMTRDTPWSSYILPLGPASRHWSCLLLIWNQIQDPKNTSVQRLKNLWIKLKKLKFAWFGLMFVGAFFSNVHVVLSSQYHKYIFQILPQLWNYISGTKEDFCFNSLFQWESAGTWKFRCLVCNYQVPKQLANSSSILTNESVI